MADTLAEGLQPVPDGLINAVREVTTRWRAALHEAREPPDLIYHYCDANALLSIFKTKSLWATGTRYLNDRTELVSSYLNLPRHLKDLPDTPASRVFKEGHAEGLIRTAADLTSRAIGMEQFVTCFSQDGDLLSQWRAYGDAGRGFALGFAPSELAVLQGDAIRNGDIRGMKYGPEDEQDLVRVLLGGLVDAITPFVRVLETSGWQPKEAAPLTARQWVGLRFAECIAELSFETKDASFRDEREWRIYARDGDYQYRATPRGIVPYRLLDMREAQSGSMPLKRIIIGPLLDELDTTRVLMYLASDHGYGHGGIDIVKSKSPFR